MEKEARCRRGQGGHPGQAEEGAGGDGDGHLDQQDPEDQAAQELLPGGDQGEGEEAGARKEGPVETTSVPGMFYIAVFVLFKHVSH